MSSSSGCAHCGGELVEDYATGQYVCTSCAVVQVEHIVETGKEWREFEEEDHTERARAEAVDEFHTLGTEIGLTNYGSVGLSARAKTLNKYARLGNTPSKSEAYLKAAFAKVNEFSDVIGLPALIKDEAKDILRQIERKREEDHKAPPRRDGYIVAVLLIASKSKLGGRTLKDLSAASRVPEKDIRTFYKQLLRHPVVVSMMRHSTSVTEQTQGLAEVYGRKLNLPYSLVSDARAVAGVACEVLEGRKPQSIAGAAVLLVTWLHHHPVNETHFALITGVSMATMRDIKRELEAQMDKLPAYLFAAPSSSSSSVRNSSSSASLSSLSPSPSPSPSQSPAFSAPAPRSTLTSSYSSLSSPSLPYNPLSSLSSSSSSSSAPLLAPRAVPASPYAHSGFSLPSDMPATPLTSASLHPPSVYM